MDFILEPISTFCESIDYGFTASAEQEEVGPKFLRITDIVGNSINWSTVPFVRCSESEYQKYALSHGDIVIARTGATTGESAYISHPPKSIFASYLVRLRTKSEYDSRYLAYALKSNFFWDWINSVMEEKSAQPNASASTMVKAKVPMPSPTQQRCIAEFLGALDDKIEINYQINNTLADIARSIFRSWFVDFDPVRAKMAAKVEGHDPERAAMAALSGKSESELDNLPRDTFCSLAEIAALFPDSLVESEQGDFPMGWKVGNFGDIACQIRATVEPKDIDPNEPYIGLEHMPRQSIALSEWGRGSEVSSQKAKFQAGDILFGKLRPYFHKVGVAPISGVCSTDILVVNAKNSHFYGLTVMAASDPRIIQYVTGSMDGTRMPRTNWEDLSKFPMVLPSEQLAERFTNLIDPMIKQIKNTAFENNSLAQTRDMLLPKLLSGELKPKEVGDNLEACSLPNVILSP